MIEARRKNLMARKITKQKRGNWTDGGEFQRICSKMATGSDKTIVMSILIA